MKKRFLLFSLIAVLFLGGQTVLAQEIQNPQANSPEARATKVLQSFSRKTDVTSSQRERIYGLFNKNSRKFETINSMDNEKMRQLKEEKMAEYIDDQLKKILTDEQFEYYLKSKSE